MNQTRRDWIDKVADAVRYAYNIDSPIDDIRNVVKNMGGKIVTDFSITDGRIIKDSDNSFTIFVSSNEKYFNGRYTRFTIAHELGHLVLHMHYKSDIEKWDQIKNGESFNRDGYSEKEFDANEFASAFLMPKNEFYRIADKHIAIHKDGKKYVNTSVLAAHFNVSEFAAINRGIHLGVFRYSIAIM